VVVVVVVVVVVAVAVREIVGLAMITTNRWQILNVW